MLRSLFTAATGMSAQQKAVDVVSNNLANANTTGFKRSQADFEDLLYHAEERPGAVRKLDQLDDRLLRIRPV